MNDDDRGGGRGNGDVADFPGAEPSASILRVGDPAGESPRLHPEALAEMRRVIVAAADDAGRRHPLALWSGAMPRPVTMATAVAMIALVGGASFWLFAVLPGSRRTDPAPLAEVRTPPPREPGTTAEPDRTSESVPATAPEPAAEPDSTAAPIPTVASAATAEPPAAARPAPATTEPVAARTPRTLQLTAPRGTRLIWTLDPAYESPLGEPRARQEQGQ